MSKIDLHTHSTTSDGKDAPGELVRKAQQRGITLLLSPTDHDTVDGLGAAEAEAKALGVGFVSGLELAINYYHPSYHNGQDPIRLHLLGYGFDYHHHNLLHELQINREHRRRRIVEIINKINDLLGISGHQQLDFDEFSVYEKTIDGTIGRPHLAQFLMQKGIVSSLQEAFDIYLGERCYVPTRDISLADGIDLIHKAGGKAVLAHPCGEEGYSLLKVAPTEEAQAKMVGDMHLHSHLDGLECFYPAHSQEKTEFFVGLAKRFGMIITGGSDHHGGERDRLGTVDVPDYVASYFLTK
ncbi:MAG: PHP domain-containing protein [Candidatus Woesearchaeota archaeon]